MITIHNYTCLHCKTAFNSVDKRRKFCSPSCSSKWAVDSKAIKFSFCKHCSKSFPISSGNNDRRKKFCNHSCAATFINRTRQRKKSGSEGKSNNLVRRPRKSHKVRQEEFITDWRLGLVEGGTKHGYVRAGIRKFLLKESNYRCSVCMFEGVNPITGNTILQIDHTDGNSSNNVYGNLRVLCPNCHAKTPTYGALNKHSGRAWKRKG